MFSRSGATIGYTTHRFRWGRLFVVLSFTFMTLGCAVRYVQQLRPTMTPPLILQIDSKDPTPLGRQTGTVMRLFFGSACVVGHMDERTYLFTAHHVVEDWWSTFAVTHEHSDLKLDFAVVSIPGTIGTAWEIAEEFPGDGEFVNCLGYYRGQSTFTEGVVANNKLGWVDATVGGGMSGGACSNEDGQLAGIIIATYEGDGIGIVVPIEWVHDVLEELGL